jgi:histidinol-phosphate phosphatase family protein
VGGVRRAAFVDRDGTLNVRPAEHDYVRSLTGFAWLPGALDGLVALDRAGYVLAVVSNQRGVARGLVSPAVLTQIEDLIQRDLEARGARISAFRYCLHDESDACDCRKPKPGLILDLARELDLDVAASWMIGDSGTDIEAGRRAGCRTALVSNAPARSGAADLVAPSLAEAAALIAGEPPQAPDDAAPTSKAATSA